MSCCGGIIPYFRPYINNILLKCAYLGLVAADILEGEKIQEYYLPDCD